LRAGRRLSPRSDFGWDGVSHSEATSGERDLGLATY
jgi:hypothetical protein